MRYSSATRPRVGVIIPAGGAGRRMGGPVPKQFLRLRGRPVLLHTLRAFNAHPDVDEIVVAGPAAYLPRIRRMVARARLDKVRSVVEGGSDRQASVAHALSALQAACTVVLVHDAVRPLADPRLITAVIRAARRWGAAVAAAPVRDTMQWEGRKGFFTRTVDRTRLWAVQTPQGFRRPLLEEAHHRARRSGFVGTDEASLVLRIGRRVRIVPSSTRNLKITTPDDLLLARLLVDN